MNSRDIARVGLLAAGLTVGSVFALPSDISWSDTTTAAGLGSSAVVNSPDSGIAAGDRGTYIQHLGCEKPKKPSCNKPGRRSTHR